MPKSYSGDLRERVIEAVEIEGASRREAAERFGVSVSSGVRWLQHGTKAEAQRRNREEEAYPHWKRMRSGYWRLSPNGRI